MIIRMFSFLKKLKLQDEIPEPEQQLSLRERAIQVFSKIEGLDDNKEMMLRALESAERAHTLLTGAPACAKSLFMLQIEKYSQNMYQDTIRIAHNRNAWLTNRRADNIIE